MIQASGLHALMRGGGGSTLQNLTPTPYLKPNLGSGFRGLGFIFRV